MCGSHAARCSVGAEPLDEEARHHLTPGVTFAQQAGALDNRGFLACNRGIGMAEGNIA